MGKLDERILEGLKELGIRKLTPIQRKAIPEILRGKSVLIIAPTGAGKTEAAMIPIFHRILNEGGMALYIAPLRALDRDMFKRFKDFWAKKLSINIAMRHGDTPQSERAKQAREKIDLLITTPETLQNMFRGRKLRLHLMRVKYVIIDEVHELMCSDRGLQLSIALERLEEYSPGFQRIGLSATIKNEKEALYFIIGNNRKGEIVKWYPEAPFEAKVVVLSKKEDVLRRVKEVVANIRSSLIFTNTREEAERYGHILGGWETISVHHGSLSKNVRESVEGMLKEGRIRGVVCTSSLELGIDVGHIDYVIQIGSPRQVIKFVQRIGRSGHKLRSKPKGEIIVVNDPLEVIESASIIELAYSGWIEENKVRGNALSPLANQIIASAIENHGKFDEKHFFKIVRRAYPYRNLSFEELHSVVEFLCSVGILRKRREGGYVATPKAREYLNENVSMIPDEERFEAVDLSGKTIGLLDEDFAINRLEVGVPIILHGRLWKVEEINEEKRRVVLSLMEFGTLSIPPRWHGDHLPVSLEVALNGYKALYSGKIPWERIKFYKKSKRIKRRIMEISEFLRKQEVRKGKIIVEIIPPERWKGSGFSIGSTLIILHSPFGHKVNTALSIYLSHYLREKMGIPCNPDWGPYHVLLGVPRRYKWEYLKEVLPRLMFNFDPEKIRGEVLTSMSISLAFLKVLRHTAQKMGGLLWTNKKNVRRRTVHPLLLLKMFSNTPVMEEAIRKFSYEKADLKRAEGIINELREGKVKVEFILGPTPFSEEIVRRSFREVDSKLKPVSQMEILRQRIESREMYYICLACGYSEKVTPMEILEKGPLASCPICGSVIIGISKRNINLKKASRKEIEDLRLSHEILKTWGYLGALALATNGVGPKTAIRILKNSGNVLEDFLKRLSEEEKRYYRTREFWRT